MRKSTLFFIVEKEKVQVNINKIVEKSKKKGLGSTKDSGVIPDGYVSIVDEDRKPMSGCFVKLLPLSSPEISVLAVKLPWKV